MGVQWKIRFLGGSQKNNIERESPEKGAWIVCRFKRGGGGVDSKLETGELICPMKFVSTEVALYFFKTTMWPFMEYCCHIQGIKFCIMIILFMHRLCSGYFAQTNIHFPKMFLPIGSNFQFSPKQIISESNIVIPLLSSHFNFCFYCRELEQNENFAR